MWMGRRPITNLIRESRTNQTHRTPHNLPALFFYFRKHLESFVEKKKTIAKSTDERTDEPTDEDFFKFFLGMWMFSLPCSYFSRCCRFFGMGDLKKTYFNDNNLKCRRRRRQSQQTNRQKGCSSYLGPPFFFFIFFARRSGSGNSSTSSFS